MLTGGSTHVLTFVAGGLGALLRVLLVPLVDRRLDAILPFAGTLAVNLLGCFAIGVGSVLLGGPARLVVLGGLLGGFTTYSAFGLLGVELLTQGRTAAALAQLGGHLAGGLLCAWMGTLVGRWLAPPL